MPPPRVSPAVLPERVLLVTVSVPPKLYMPPPLPRVAELPERVLLVTVSVLSAVVDAAAVAVGRVAGEGAVRSRLPCRWPSCGCRRRCRSCPSCCRRACCWSRSACCRTCCRCRRRCRRPMLPERVLLVTVSCAAQSVVDAAAVVAGRVAGEGAVGHGRAVGSRCRCVPSSCRCRRRPRRPSCRRGCCWSRSSCRRRSS